MSSRLPRFRIFAVGVLAVAIPAALAVAPAASASGRGHGPQNEFRQTNLVSDISGAAQLIDPNLKNAWGLALGPTTPLWVADNGTSVSTLYSITPGGAAPAGAAHGHPAADGLEPDRPGVQPDQRLRGQDQGGQRARAVHLLLGGRPDHRVEPGRRSGVNGASTATVEYSSPIGAVFKGLTLASTRFGTFLYATDFHNGRVDVFDSRFHPVRLPGSFRDRHLPRGYAPFGIRAINGLIYVTYAKQDADRHDDVAGRGHGFIDVFTASGFMVERLVSRGDLDSPWGLTVAPRGFGPFGGKLLVGNFGDGRIHAYGLFSGRPDGTLRGQHHQPVTIDGLWALQFGTATTGGTGTLLFSAGPNGEANGLLGALNPDR